MVVEPRDMPAHVIAIARAAGHDLIFAHEPGSGLRKASAADGLAPDLSMFEVEEPSFGNFLGPRQHLLLGRRPVVLAFKIRGTLPNLAFASAVEVYLSVENFMRFLHLSYPSDLRTNPCARFV